MSEIREKWGRYGCCTETSHSTAPLRLYDVAIDLLLFASCGVDDVEGSQRVKNCVMRTMMTELSTEEGGFGWLVGLL